MLMRKLVCAHIYKTRTINVAFSFGDSFKAIRMRKIENTITYHPPNGVRLGQVTMTATWQYEWQQAAKKKDKYNSNNNGTPKVNTCV